MDSMAVSLSRSHASRVASVSESEAAAVTVVRERSLAVLCRARCSVQCCIRGERSKCSSVRGDLRRARQPLTVRRSLFPLLQPPTATAAMSFSVSFNDSARTPLMGGGGQQALSPSAAARGGGSVDGAAAQREAACCSSAADAPCTECGENSKSHDEPQSAGAAVSLTATARLLLFACSLRSLFSMFEAFIPFFAGGRIFATTDKPYCQLKRVRMRACCRSAQGSGSCVRLLRDCLCVYLSLTRRSWRAGDRQYHC